MEFPTLLQGWVSHFCTEGSGWAMRFLSTTFPNAPAHPPPPILFDQSLSYVYIELQAQILGEHVFLTFHCYLIVSHVFHQYILRRKHY